MPDFRARLASPTGEVVERDYTAVDADSLRRELEKQDYLVLAVQRRSAMLGAMGELFRRKKKINLKEFLFFNQEFAALVRAGLPILESLKLLTERRKSPVFKQALEDVRDRVKSGESLSDAFAAQEVFPPLYSSTLASGERSGEIAVMLQRYVKYTQTLLNVKKKVVSSMTYPALLVAMSVLVVIALLTFVLPRFEGLFVDFDAELPFITRAVLAASHFVRDNWILLIAGTIGTVVGVTVWRKTPVGRRMFERMWYRTPLFGPIANKFAVTRFSRTLASLVSGGLPLVQCLEIVTRSMGVAIFEDALRKVTDKVRTGDALWASLDETGLFPDMMIEMVKVGESSGSLAPMLEHVSDFTDQEIDHELQTLVSLVEPILLVVMAAIVAGMLLAIYFPLLQLYAKTGI